ncbi:hypothetical protein YPPY95_1186, partial [Yersinia pestis PY-95]
MGGLA